MPTNPLSIVVAKETLPLRHLSVLREIRSYFHQDSQSYSLHPHLRGNFYANKAPVYQNTHTEYLRSLGNLLSPVHFQGLYSRWVSCYAFFKWWRLLCLHPHCLGFKTPFVTLNINFGTLTPVSFVLVLRCYLTHQRCFL